MTSNDDEEQSKVLTISEGPIKNVLRKKSAIMQITMSLLANVTIISSGMGLGFPAITLNALTDPNSSTALSIQQGSWFGIYNVKIF